MIDPKAFQPLKIRNGLLVDLSHDEYPTQVRGADDDYVPLPPDGTHFVMVTKGECAIMYDGRSFRITQGMFAVIPGPGSLDAYMSQALIITRLNYTGLFQIGGPIEPRGRLKYIDGCSDTLLVGPPVVGEPCLNHLHMPPGTNQTQHTHPSSRIGVILNGRGECRTPNAVVALEPGMGWYIPTGCEHSFFTTDDVLDVIAWHPETDTGPSHQNHPMVNRTYVEGESAANIDAIRTDAITA
jgi:mannose-6-phosphate isomerase-like protein (cupin superfamily)